MTSCVTEFDIPVREFQWEYRNMKKILQELGDAIMYRLFLSFRTNRNTKNHQRAKRKDGFILLSKKFNLKTVKEKIF